MSFSFVYDVERLRHIKTGELITESQFEKMAELLNFEVVAIDILNAQYELVDVSLDVEGSGYYLPSKIHGDPLDCYPEEFEYEIDSMKDANDNDWNNLVTEDERRDMMDILVQKVKNHDYDVSYNCSYDCNLY